jgi:hypothetical protein
VSGNYDDWDQTHYDDAYQKLMSRKAPPPEPALGICCFHLTEIQSCFGLGNDLYATISLLDNNKNEVYKNTTLNPINDKEPWEFTTPFGPKMRITGEHEGDYVQFNYGNIDWKSSDTETTNQNGWCSTGGELDV